MNFSDLEQINKIHPEVSNPQQRKSVAVMTIETGRNILFTSEAAKCYGMKKGMYVHFGRKEKNWYFVVNDVSTGFPVNQLKAGGAVRIHSSGLVRLLLKSLKCKIGDRYYVQSTNNEHNRCKVIEVLTHRTVQQLKGKSE
jgi:hypothetical protein